MIFRFRCLYIEIFVFLPRCSPERVCAPPLEDYLKSSSCILNLPESISSLLYVTSAPFRTRVTEEIFLHLLILSLIASLNLPIVLNPVIFRYVKTLTRNGITQLHNTVVGVAVEIDGEIYRVVGCHCI